MGIWAKSPVECVYFDSFGEKPTELIGQTLRQFRKVYRSNAKLQSIYSDVCGHYCVYFLYFMSIGFDFSSIIKMLKSCNEPDQFVRNFVNFQINK